MYNYVVNSFNTFKSLLYFHLFDFKVYICIANCFVFYNIALIRQAMPLPVYNKNITILFGNLQCIICQIWRKDYYKIGKVAIEFLKTLQSS